MIEDLNSVPIEDLVGQLLNRRNEILTPDGLVIPSVYELLVCLKPLACVEVVPVRKVDEYQLGVISRATGPESGKLAVLGSGISKNEQVKDTISRTLFTDLEISSFRFFGSLTEETPFRLGQHLHGPKLSPDIAYDPTKHAIGIAYLVEIDGEPSPRNEAGRFFWIRRDEIPPVTAYNHWIILNAAFNYLESH